MSSRSVFLLLLAIGLVILGTRVMPLSGVKGPVSTGEIVGLEIIELKDGAPSSWGFGALLQVELASGARVEARGPVERKAGVGTRSAAPPADVLEARLAARLRTLGLTPGKTVRLARERDKDSGAVYWRAVEAPTLFVWFPAMLSWGLGAILAGLAWLWRARPGHPGGSVPH